jgi:hypothetical protein
MGLGRQPACLVAVAVVPLVGIVSELLFKDDVSLICEYSAWFMDNIPTIVLAEDWRVAAYVAACKEIWKTTGQPVKDELLRLLHKGDFEAVLPSPPICPPVCTREIPKYKSFEECAAGIPKIPDIQVNKLMKSVGAHPLFLETIKVSEVEKTIRHGGVKRFDATSVLPKHVWNVTINDLYEMHKDTADDIVHHVALKYGDHPKPGSLLSYSGDATCENKLLEIRQDVQKWGVRSFKASLAKMFYIPYILRRYCHENPSFKQVAELSKSFDKSVVHRFVAFNNTRNAEVQRRFLKFRNKNKALITSNVHTKYFPKFMEGVDVASKLGISNSVLTTHQYLWFGASHGALHHDFQDNVLIQISGEAEVIIVPPNCSHFILDGSHVQKQDLNYLWPDLTDGWRYKAPFYHFQLKAGEGVVIPATAPHRIISWDNFRIGMNSFFEPKYKQMQWGSTAPANFYSLQPDSLLAIRSLWTESLQHLFDTRRIVLAMHTSKLEYI